MYFEKVWGRKMDLRMKYVKEQSFWVDMKILFHTYAAVFISSK
jgi:lipopolysaccharide/colanic/teichoic acid biosynthesis glycosyltransferase